MPERQPAFDADEQSIEHAKVGTAPPRLAGGSAVSSLQSEDHLQRQPRMRKDADEMHQIAEQVGNRLAAGTVTRGKDGTARLLAADQQLACGARLDARHVVS